MILAGDIGGTNTHLALLSSQAALERSDDRPSDRSTCSSIYGAEAGNVALKLMAIGGIYLGEGIAPKILPKLADGAFMRAFTDKVGSPRSSKPSRCG